MRSRIKLYFYLAAFLSGSLVLLFGGPSATL
ncbi:hypothetical protein C7435_0401 [Maricaulis maris]|uniref:Uncharacterized protein n=1 Tax=Maricaulis maris TaxID=74318 RepID=A0A495DM15_9PROT|nr:hypothetical protein C7435_0401 [Maricaulis maris]